MAVTGTGKWYGKALLSLLNKEIDIDTDTLKMMLCTSTYTPDQDTHQYKSSVTNEVTGTGYTATGATLTGVTVAYTAGTNTVKIDCNDVVWANSTITARHAVVYDASPASDATRPLLCYITFASDVTSTAGDFTVTIDAAGLLTGVVGA